MNNIEQRNFKADRMGIERRDGKAPVLSGHASMFNTEYNVGGWFIEKVAPGAFKRAILEDDVRALFNHDANFVLGRNKSSTLRLSEDDIGLAIEIDPPDTQLVRDLVLTPIERGDINQMSFGFRVVKEQWEERGKDLVRTLLDCELFDVSPVTYPASPTTDIGLRSLEAFKKTLVRAPTEGYILRKHRIMAARAA